MSNQPYGTTTCRFRAEYDRLTDDLALAEQRLRDAQHRAHTRGADTLTLGGFKDATSPRSVQGRHDVTYGDVVRLLTERCESLRARVNRMRDQL